MRQKIPGGWLLSLNHCQNIMAEPCVPWLQLVGLFKLMSEVGNDATMHGRCGRQDAMHNTRSSEGLRAFCEGSHGFQHAQHDALDRPYPPLDKLACC